MEVREKGKENGEGGEKENGEGGVASPDRRKSLTRSWKSFRGRVNPKVSKGGGTIGRAGSGSSIPVITTTTTSSSTTSSSKKAPPPVPPRRQKALSADAPRKLDYSNGSKTFNGT